ncbi:MAG: phosphate/phosphite/phosphonate ABC transporter substrate-binding protein [Deferrisomatales bacterium]
MRASPSPPPPSVRPREAPRRNAARGGRRLLAPALAAALALGVAGCRGAPPSFRVGYMICNSEAETRARFAPLTAYLSEATGARFEPVYLDTFDVEEAFGAGRFEFAHTNSLLYVILRERYQARLVAAERRGAFGVRTRGVLIARKDAGLESLADVRGRRLMFGPQWAPFGFLAQYALLLEHGVDPEADLALYSIPRGSWKHEKIIYSVLYGAYDVGAAPLIDLEEMVAEGRVADDDFVVLARSELAPYCTFSASARVEPEWIDKVRQALLALGPETTAQVDGERLQVLKRALVTGFEAVDDGAYEPLRRWARQAKMPPYEEY